MRLLLFGGWCCCNSRARVSRRCSFPCCFSGTLAPPLAPPQQKKQASFVPRLRQRPDIVCLAAGQLAYIRWRSWPLREYIVYLRSRAIGQIGETGSNPLQGLNRKALVSLIERQLHLWPFTGTRERLVCSKTSVATISSASYKLQHVKNMACRGITDLVNVDADKCCVMTQRYLDACSMFEAARWYHRNVNKHLSLPQLTVQAI